MWGLAGTRLPPMAAYGSGKLVPVVFKHPFQIDLGTSES